MAGGAGGIVHIPWYATALRSDKLEEALDEIAPVALRFGASHYEVYRYRDDRYKFLQTAAFADPMDFDRYWYGEEFATWRMVNSGFFQVPVLYGWADRTADGAAVVEAVTPAAGNGEADEDDQ